MNLTLIKSDGSIDRAAVMRDAWRGWIYVQRKGWHHPGDDDRWSWERCLRLSLARARQERSMRQMDVIGAAVRALVEAG